MAERKNSSRSTTNKSSRTTGNTGRSKSSTAAKSTGRSKKAMEEQRLREEALQRNLRNRRITSVILLAVGLFMTLLAIIPGSEGWNALYNVLHGLFGFAAYALGPVMIYMAVVISAKQPKNTIAVTIFKASFLLLLVCAGAEIIGIGKVNGENFGEVVKNLYVNGKDFKGGGFFALILGVPLLFLGRMGALAMVIIMLLGFVLLMIDMPIDELFKKIGNSVKKAGANAAEKRDIRREESAIANEEYRRMQQEKRAAKQQRDREIAAIREKEKQARHNADVEARRKKLEEMKAVYNSVDDINNVSAEKPVENGEHEKKVQPAKIDSSAKPEKAEERSDSPVLSRTSEINILGQKPQPQEIVEQKQETRDYQQALKKYMEKRHPIMRDEEPVNEEKYEADIDLVPIVDALDKLNAEKGPARVSKIVDAPKSEITNSDKLSMEKEFADISEIDEAELSFDPEDIAEPAEPKPTESKLLLDPPSAGKIDNEKEILPFEELHSFTQVELPVQSDVYRLPPMSLLNEAKKPVPQADIEQEIRRNADKLVETLKSFGVSTTYLGASRGPSVTRYELQPAPGVKISKIVNLSDDVALNLAVSGVRVAPVPDKAAVGIEIPNKVKDTVFFRELVDTTEFSKTFDKKLDTVLGKDISGTTIHCNVSKMPHLLIAGTTGSGKSVCVNSIIMSILMKSTPDDVRLIMVDPKQVEFMMYNGIPHLLIPVVTDPKKAAGALAWAVTEMEKRYTLFSENNVRNIDGYNDLCKNNAELARMPHIVIFIDELADLMMASPKDVEDSIVRLAQKARAAGMHLVIATQKPTVQVVTGLIKGNIPSRIALMVASQVDSRVILDAAGAEKLLGNGDMLYMPVGSPKPIRLQGCYVSDDEVERVTQFITQAFKAEYDESIMAEIERQAERVSNGDKGVGTEDSEDDGDVDEKLDEAIEFVVSAGQASTSVLQRHLKLGYGRAARLIDTMEKMGIVGPYAGSKPRAVLMTKQEWYERKLRQE
ncbi:MAG: DNA translocase FtsK [Oscillospiraceae bacterium]